jgi:hypothetical protein
MHFLSKVVIYVYNKKCYARVVIYITSMSIHIAFTSFFDTPECTNFFSSSNVINESCDLFLFFVGVHKNKKI